MNPYLDLLLLQRSCIALWSSLTSNSSIRVVLRCSVSLELFALLTAFFVFCCQSACVYLQCRSCPSVSLAYM